jgi:hypothetical protein
MRCRDLDDYVSSLGILGSLKITLDKVRYLT